MPIAMASDAERTAMEEKGTSAAGNSLLLVESNILKGISSGAFNNSNSEHHKQRIHILK
jgi:hypothetical protein